MYKTLHKKPGILQQGCHGSTQLPFKKVMALHLELMRGGDLTASEREPGERQKRSKKSP
jgi:hypothetical protein